MSEDSRRGFGSRGSSHDPQNEHRPPLEQPTGRRRRSLDDEGGTSVSDLLAKHGGGKQLPPHEQADPRRQPQQPPQAAPQRHPAPPQQHPMPMAHPPVPQGAPHSGQWPADPAAPQQQPMDPQQGGRRRAREQTSGSQRVPVEQQFDPRLAPQQRPPQQFPPQQNRPPLEQPSARRLAQPEPPQATGRRALPEPPAGRPPMEQPTGRRALPDPPQQQPLSPPGMPPQEAQQRRSAELQQGGRRFPQANPPVPPGAPAPGPARQQQQQRPPLEQPSAQQPLNQPRFPRDHTSGPQRLPGGPVPPPGAGPAQPPAPAPAPAQPKTSSADSDFELDERRRKIDATLARFSAVHDEMAEIEQAEKQRRGKLTRLIRIEESAELGPEFSAQLRSKLDSEDRAIRSPKVPIRQLHATMHHAAPDRADRNTRNGIAAGSGAVGASGDEGVTALIDQIPDEPDDDVPVEAEPEPLAEAGGVDGGGDDGDPPLLPPQRLNPKARLALRGVAVAVAALVFVVLGTGWVTKVWLDGQFREVDALDQNSSSILQKDKQYGAENFLMVGSDTRANSRAEDGVGSETSSEGARSDTVMIAHVPADRKRVVMVSFPRDLNTQIPDCNGWDPKTGQQTSKKVAGSKQKLNAAYAIGGPKCLTKLVQNLSGLHINHFVAIDFQGFKAMVDAVKGVEICVSKPMKDAEIGVVIPDAGKQTINGDAALSFVRARKVEGDTTGDYGRIKRQQAFLSSLLRKAMSSQVLTSPSRLRDFASAFAKATYGENVDVSQLLTLGESLNGLEAGRVTFTTVPTTTTKLEDNSFREDLRTEATKALFNAIINKAPLPGEKPSSNGSPDPQAGGPVGPPPTAKEVPVQVLNGSSKPRLAETTAESLRKAGFQVVNVSGAGEQVQRTVIRYSAERALHAKVLQGVVPGALLEEVPNMGGSVRLLLGPEFEWKTSSGGGQNQQPSTSQTPPPLPKDLATVNAADEICK